MRLQRSLCVVAVALAFIVVVMGAYVRLSDAGLGCPDWPFCYGKPVPADIADGHALAKAWKEMGHRYLAGTLGLLILAHLALTRTPFGRQIFAVGNDVEMAKKAGIRTGRILAAVYLISGLCAAVAAMVTLGQLGAVSPKFGEQKEFAAIAAAVLGGASLFGGRGNVLPGTLLGALLIQSIENGLVIVNANPYLYPMVTSLVIFAAVILESLRNRLKSSQA